MIGTRLSHYRILEKLGEGGMGVVYRAEDTRLNRQVAIKVLPEAFAGDPERMARFEREAKLLASLSHQNIAAIHGLEEADGKRFIVMELAEGETLAKRISRGPLPVDEALQVCRQIAEGLEAAHEKGIIHRDLKPSNVMVSAEGKVKILDFGLAKAFYERAAPVDPSRSPTITDEMTRPGVVLGTAAYMSPEQARGKAVDKRADIWGFGCILYESLAGKRAFQGDTITETVAAILKSEPEWSTLPSEVPAVVRSLLRRCLQKDPGLRLHDIADARIEIGEFAAGAGFPEEAVTAPRRLSLLSPTAGVAVALLAGILATWAALKYFRPAPSVSVTRSIVKVEPGQFLSGLLYLGRPNVTALALSSNGKFLIYSATPDMQEKSRLYLRELDQLQAKPIPGTEGGSSPFLSPDDQWAGFWVRDKLMKIRLAGGVASPLCDVSTVNYSGASWGSDNNIVFTPEYTGGLFRVSADGGSRTELTRLDPAKEEYSHRFPHYLPDGKSILFTITRNSVSVPSSIGLLDVATAKYRVILEDAADARYVPSGHLVFLRRGTLMAVPFDTGRLEPKGQPVALISNVMQSLNSGDASGTTAAGQYDVSDSGSMAYAQGGVYAAEANSLVWVDKKGVTQPAVPFNRNFGSPRISPDGSKIAYFNWGEERVYVYDLDRGIETRLTDEGYTGAELAWTPDGRSLVFGWAKNGPPNLYRKPASRSLDLERLTTGASWEDPKSFSPDGETLAFTRQTPGTRALTADILLLRMRDKQATPFLNSAYDECNAEFSPGGEWLAYQSNESGRYEVYVTAFAPNGAIEPTQVSHDGGTEPLWARKHNQFFFRNLSGDEMWAVDFRTDNGFVPGKPYLLFHRPGFLNALGRARMYDVALDDQRFLMVKREETEPTSVTELILVQNWFEELKRLVPTGK